MLINFSFIEFPGCYFLIIRTSIRYNWTLTINYPACLSRLLCFRCWIELLRDILVSLFYRHRIVVACLVLRHVSHPKNVFPLVLTLSLSRLFVSNGERNKEICCYIKPYPWRGPFSPNNFRSSIRIFSLCFSFNSKYMERILPLTADRVRDVFTGIFHLPETNK